MWLTDLDDALRNGGLRFWVSPGWERFGHGDMADIRAIFIHHTGGGSARDWLIVKNGRPGLPGPLAPLTLERDGLVRLLAAGQSWHAGTGRHPLVGVNNGNLHCIGIEGVSPGSGPNAWTPEQRREYPRLAAALCRHYRLAPARVIFHKEWATPPGRKIDAGEWDPNAFRREVAQLLSGTPLSVKPTRRKLIEPMERIVRGSGMVKFNCSVGKASATHESAFLVISLREGTAASFSIFAQDDDSGTGQKEWNNLAMHAGRSDRVYWSLPDGTTQLVVHYKEVTDEAVISIEMRAK